MDSGLLHTLLGIESRHDLQGHPKVGASWEGFVIRELLIRLGAADDVAYFWAAQTGAELDLLVVRGQRKVGFEIRRTTAPRTTKSMWSAMDALGLERIDVVHAGDRTFPLHERVRAVAISRVERDVEPL
jgi:predicted AAA+ superfamily ATPase